MKFSSSLIAIAIVIVAIIAIVWYYCSRNESMTKIYRGVGYGTSDGIGAGMVTSFAVPDYHFSFFDGQTQESCDLCPSPIICPKCPQFARNQEHFSQKNDDGTVRADVIYYGDSHEDINNCGHCKPYDELIRENTNMDLGEKPHVMIVNPPDTSRGCWPSDPKCAYDPLYGWGKDGDAYTASEQTTCNVDSNYLMDDVGYWTARDRTGASYYKSPSRHDLANAPKFCARNESFIQPSDFDDVRTAAIAKPPARGLKRKQTACMPYEMNAYDILYRDIMGLDLDQSSHDDNCVTVGLNDYTYKDSCPYQQECGN